MIDGHLLEQNVLDVFWASADAGHKLALLRYVAEFVVPRPDDWDRAAIREAMRDSTGMLTADDCFLCGNTARVLHWHHLIQIQNGGSNTLRNFVGLCPSCHAAVHPWLETWRQNVKGWYCVGDVNTQRAQTTLTAQDQQVKR